MSASERTYRADIDGLRAIAVMAVLVYHAFPQWLPGGFVGVDVFFVISGFLITAILLGEVSKGEFSILRFYVRRARRLFPALLVVMIVSAIACWAFMFGFEWRNIGKHLVAGAAYLSNVLLWREVGYFDPQAEAKPLLHLWSLGVEEQFYLVWPLLLWLMYRAARQRPLLLTGGLALMSFVACIWVTRTNLPAAFYLPLTRFWELAAGGMLAMTLLRKSGPQARGMQFVGIAGLVLIVVSLLLDYAPGTFPGAVAVIPVAGSALVILAGPGSWANRHVLGSQPFVYIGRISYPLYLWHWPLLSLAFLVTDGELTPQLRCGLLVLAMLLAGLTERFVERPFRASVPAPQAFVQARNLWIATAAVGVLGLIVWQGFLPARAQASAVASRVESAKLDWNAPVNAEIRRNPAARIVLIGDSHMQQYWPRVLRVVDETRNPLLPSIELVTSSGCAPVPGLARIGNPCHEFVAAALAGSRAPEVTRVVLAASWAGLASRDDLYLASDPQRRPIRFLAAEGRGPLEQWTRELASLRAMGKDVVVVLSSPRGRAVRPELQYDRWRAAATGVEVSIPRNELYAEVAGVDDAIRAAATAAGARIVEPFDLICSAERCAVIDDEGRPIFTDESHLRASYVRDNARFLDELLR
jgi:peptidoglycan/LPS O-acetylase OafA/YrhL